MFVRRRVLQGLLEPMSGILTKPAMNSWMPGGQGSAQRFWSAVKKDIQKYFETKISIIQTKYWKPAEKVANPLAYQLPSLHESTNYFHKNMLGKQLSLQPWKPSGHGKPQHLWFDMWNWWEFNFFIYDCFYLWNIWSRSPKWLRHLESYFTCSFFPH